MSYSCLSNSRRVDIEKTLSNLLSPEQVGSILGLKPGTVCQMLRERKLPGMKIGKAWRVEEEDLRAYISQQKKAAVGGGGI